MKPFELEKAFNGAALCTRDGHDVRIICYNRKDSHNRAPLIGLVLSSSGHNERIIQYDNFGRQINFCKDLDLFLKD